MQRAADKFERKYPFPNIPFVCDEAGGLPTFPEALGWIVIGASFLTLCYGFLGIA